MKRVKAIIALLAAFVLGVLIAFYFEENYRSIVRDCFKLFQGGKIVFFGKNFHFPGTYFIFSFGLFCASLAALVFKKRFREKLRSVGLVIVLFFATTLLTTYIDSTFYLIGCSDCSNGIKRLHRNAINFDFHFTTGLSISLIPLLWKFSKSLASKP